MEESAMVTRALVVHSRPEFAAAMRDALTAVGVEVFVATDGHAAVRDVETWAPDVVLVDLTLEPLDGWYVVAALGTLRDRPLMVVRLGDASEAPRAVALGADAWVDDDVHVVAAAGRLVPAIAA
jgi:DNA-binding response OmpR family regulator